MPIEYVTVELRPRIQSCNIFICLKQPVEVHLVQVSIFEHTVVLEIAKNPITINMPSVNIITTSMSNLNVSGKWIVFRVQTRPSNTSNGDFSAECINHLDNIENDRADERENLMIPARNKPLTLLCYHCRHSISKHNIVFQRILKLPSSDCLPAEWYCCSKTPINLNEILSPQYHDYFYEGHYALMNKKIFERDIRIDKTEVICDWCNSVLGAIVENYKSAVKLWNYAVRYQLMSSPENHISPSTPLDDFKLALRVCVFVDKVTDIVFIATEGAITHSMKLKVIENKLNSLIESDITEKRTVNMVEKTIFKVLYSSLNSAVDKQTILDSYICEVGFISLSDGINYLLETTQRLPPNCSYVDEFRVGFVIY